MSDATTLPPCGIYRTGTALGADPKSVPANRLVMFHNHSDKNMPFVQLPKENTNNTWTFHSIGPGVGEDEDFIAALKPLKPQGVYVLINNILTGENTIPKGTLVQLGYNRNADPILFLGFWRDGTVAFPKKGYKFDDLGILENLQSTILASAPQQEEPPEKSVIH